MKKTADNTDLLLAQLRDMHYPKKVDVADRVMDAIEQQPNTHKVRKLHQWYRYTAAVAACVAALFAINLTLLYTRSYDETQINNLLTDVYSFNTADLSAVEESSFSQTWFEQI